MPAPRTRLSGDLLASNARLAQPIKVCSMLVLVARLPPAFASNESLAAWSVDCGSRGLRFTAPTALADRAGCC